MKSLYKPRKIRTLGRFPEKKSARPIYESLRSLLLIYAIKADEVMRRTLLDISSLLELLVSQGILLLRLADVCKSGQQLTPLPAIDGLVTLVRTQFLCHFFCDVHRSSFLQQRKSGIVLKTRKKCRVIIMLLKQPYMM